MDAIEPAEDLVRKLIVSRMLTTSQNGIVGIEGGVVSIKHSRKVLFSQTVDLSNLPKRRRRIPNLGPATITDDE